MTMDPREKQREEAHIKWLINKVEKLERKTKAFDAFIYAYHRTFDLEDVSEYEDYAQCHPWNQ